MQIIKVLQKTESFKSKTKRIKTGNFQKVPSNSSAEFIIKSILRERETGNIQKVPSNSSAEFIIKSILRERDRQHSKGAEQLFC